MRTSLPLAIGLFLAGTAQAQDLNVITGVEVKDEGNSVLVTVKGSKPPNFTTFSMADPARFVIDLSEAKFQGVPEDLRVDGLIRVVKNLAYGSGATAIARVMIAFSVDVEPPDVQIEGTSLVMKVAKPAGAAVAAAQPAGAATPGATAAGAAGAAGAGAAGEAAAAAATAAKAQADEEARQEALAREQIEAEAKEQARLASEATAKEREAKAKADAEAKAREAEKLAAEQAAADEAARAAAEARRAEIKAKAAAESAQPPKADANAQSEADAKAQREVEQALAAQQAADAAAKAAKAAEAAPAPEPAQARAPPPAPAPAAAAPPVQAPAPARAEPPAPEPAVVASPARPAKLQAVGFQQLPTVSRVFVKTTVPPRFTITDVGDDVVRLEVENTRSLRRNDTRPLDTSFFPSAVAMITASRKGTSYVLDIKLKKRVPYQQKVEGDVLAIDFERPPAEPAQGAGAPGRAAPAEGEPGEAGLENRQGLMVSPEAKDEGAEPADDAEPAAEPQPKQ